MMDEFYRLGRKYLDRADQYAQDILSGKIPSCKWTRLAVERNQRDLETAHKKGLVFNEYAAARVLVFFSLLKHSKGEWAGQTVDLSPWQCWIISVVFGWVWADTGLRRFRTVYEEVARKNGKTTKLAGIGLYALTKDNEAGPEVYSAATKKDQAKILFDEATRMVLQSPHLKRRLQHYRNNLNMPANMGKFEPLSSDTNSLDGLNPSCALVDEFHAHKTSEMWDVLASALGARRQPLLWAITTAGFNKLGPCYERREYATKVLQGIIEDDEFFAIIYTIDDGDNWKDEHVWIKANPNLDVSISLNYLRAEARQAEQMPSALNNFLTKHLNVWVNAEKAWMNMDKWRACCRPCRLDDITDKVESAWAGLDLASTSDICSLGIVCRMKDGSIKAFSRNYLPEDAVKLRVQKNQVPYDAWARDGWLILTPGNVTDYNFIKADIYRLMKRLPLKEIAFDRWNSSQLVNDLMADGAPMVEFGQGYASMNPAMKEFERLVLAGELEHEDNPVLTWAVSNLVIQQDPAGNIKPAKNKSTEKIDPAVALIMAIGRAMLRTEKKVDTLFVEI